MRRRAFEYMRSLRYILTGRPVTLDDCLLAAPAGRAAIKLATHMETLVGEQRVLTQLVAKLTWQFAGRKVKLHVVCGVLRDSDSRSEIAEAVRRANGRLAQLESRLRAAASVDGIGGRFAAERLEAASAGAGAAYH